MGNCYNYKKNTHFVIFLDEMKKHYSLNIKDEINKKNDSIIVGESEKYSLGKYCSVKVCEAQNFNWNIPILLQFYRYEEKSITLPSWKIIRQKFSFRLSFAILVLS